MSCKHPQGYHDNDRQDYEPPKTPDNKKYEIQRAEIIGPHLVLEVLYPNCSLCAYEGRKVMVFLHTSTLDALKWREIDPHFRVFSKLGIKVGNIAPSPSARFPASTEGWADAINYARSKT
jgi:hypothetical protein